MTEVSLRDVNDNWVANVIVSSKTFPSVVFWEGRYFVRLYWKYYIEANVAIAIDTLLVLRSKEELVSPNLRRKR